MLNFSLLAIIFVWLIYAATSRKDSLVYILFSAPILRWVGKYSYALYVFHLPIALLILKPNIPWLSSMPILAEVELFVFYFGVCIGCAFLSWHLYEKHFLKLKKYFHPN